MPAERTGSFPLMNLAADYGVDYGDVLLMAEGVGARLRGEYGETQARHRMWSRAQDAAVAACERQAKSVVDLYAAVHCHASARWRS